MARRRVRRATDQETQARRVYQPVANVAASDRGAAVEPRTRTEHSAFFRDRDRAARLELAARAGSISRVERQELGLVQARMRNFWTEEMASAARRPSPLVALAPGSPASRGPKRRPAPSPSATPGSGRKPVSGVARPSRRGGSGTTVVQRWLDPAVLKQRPRDRRISTISHKAFEYNGYRKSKNRRQRLEELKDLEVTIYRYLDQNRGFDTSLHPVSAWVKELMNDVQREHRELVTASIQASDTDPPVAGFTKLSKKEQGLVRRLWKDLVNETGNIRITETESYTDKIDDQKKTRQHPGFRFEVLAQFARLLESATGREIVAQVDQDTKGKKLVKLQPGMAQGTNRIPGSEFAAAPSVTTGADKMEEVDINSLWRGQFRAKSRRERYRRQFVELKLGSLSGPAERAKAIYDARKIRGAAGVKIDGKYYRFGKGTAVNVTMTRDIPDASEHHTSRMVDTAGRELVFPNFFTLGHELGHAVHMMGGMALGDKDDKVSNDLFPKVGGNSARMQDWSNLEELANITSVENALRNEYGLTERYGHSNQAGFQKKHLGLVRDQLFPLSDQQPHPQRQPVETAIGTVSTALGDMKIPEARQAIRATIQLFSNRLPTVFPGFTATELVQMRGDLDQARGLVRSPDPTNLAAAVTALQAARQKIVTAKQRVAQALAQQALQQQQQGGGGILGALGRGISGIGRGLSWLAGYG